MALFKSKNTTFGIDLGTSSIKVVQLENRGGRPTLVTYGLIEQSGDIVKVSLSEVQRGIVKAVKKLSKRAHITATRAVASLPNFTVFSSVINLPAMSRRDLASAVRWEAKKFVPMPIEEMVLDWQVLGPGGLAAASPTNKDKDTDGKRRSAESSSKSGSTNVLLTAAPKNLVARYLDLFKSADIPLGSLETESFALERSLIGHDRSPIMIVDIGALNTNISVTVESVPLVNRSIDVGGETITRAIAGSLTVDFARAEQLKRDFGITATQSGGGQIPKTIEFVISSIINEIRYVLNLYRNQSVATASGKNIEKIILSGGGAYLSGLDQYLARLLNLKVFIGNPWARVSFPEELVPVLDEVGSRFAVAVGLAMRDL